MQGKVIVIEGIDGSGKSTQFDMLKARLEREKTRFVYQRFPRYDNPSSQLVRMYLAGEFGTDPDSVGPYTASAYYAVDRSAAFSGELGEAHRAGELMLMDRYTTANLIHQGAKLYRGEKDRRELEAYADWLCDFEYERLALPKPDIVFLLNMPAEKSAELIRNRGGNADIHEADADYLSRCAKTAMLMAGRYDWEVVNCVAGEALRTPENISQEIYNTIIKTVFYRGE